MKSKAFHFAFAKPPGWMWLFSFVVFAILKIWLVGDEEITARHAPYDQSWFINAAHYMIQGQWLGPYNLEALIRQPGYPLWIRWAHALHIPLRLAVELLLIASASCFSASLIKFMLPRWVSLVAFVTIIFHPASFSLNNESISETLYAPLLVISLSGLLSIFAEPKGRFYLAWALLTASALALLWNTRHENILLVFLLTAYGLLFFLFRWRGGYPWQNTLRILLPVFCILFFTISTFTVALRWSNYRVYGLFETSEMFAAGWTHLAGALLLPKQENPRRFISVPKEVRERVYAASPTFRELRPYLEGNSGKTWLKWGCQADQVCDDISNGWFIWALRDAARQAGHYRNAVETDRYYQRIADEITQTCKEGKLVCKRKAGAALTFLHPYPSTYLKFIPESLFQTLAFFVQEEPYQADDAVFVSPPIRRLFDETAGRKSVTNGGHPLKRSIQMGITRYHAKFLLIMGVLTPVPVLFLILNLRRLEERTLFLLSMLFIAIVSRILLITLWKASVTNDPNPRYLYPVMGISSVFLILIFFEGAKVFAKRIAGKAGLKTASV